MILSSLRTLKDHAGAREESLTPASDPLHRMLNRATWDPSALLFRARANVGERRADTGPARGTHRT
jgi:hypothetical protein